MTIQFSSRGTVVVTALVTALTCATIAYAYDTKLDSTEDFLTKAAALLNATVVPDVPGQRCQKFVDKAGRFIEKSTASIEKAKTCAG